MRSCKKKSRWPGLFPMNDMSCCHAHEPLPPQPCRSGPRNDPLPAAPAVASVNAPVGKWTHGPSISASVNGATTRVLGVERNAAEVHQYLQR